MQKDLQDPAELDTGKPTFHAFSLKKRPNNTAMENTNISHVLVMAWIDI